MASTKELYSILGVDETASDAEIRSAYEHLIADTPEGTPEYDSITHAYSVLSDMDKRAMYDVTGKVKGGIRHSSTSGRGNKKQKARSILNTLFLAGAAVTTICFILQWSGAMGTTPFYWTCGISLLLKIAEYILRLIP